MGKYISDFAHLHLHTEYSLLDGAIRIKDLIQKVSKMGQPAVAMTDHGNMFGACKFLDSLEEFNKKVEKHNAQEENKDNQKQKLKGIVGCEFYVSPDLNVKVGGVDYSHLILLAKNKTGYKSLAKLNSIAAIDGFYYKPRIDYKTLREHHDGLICLSACIAGDIPKLILARRYDEAEKLALELKDMFGEDFYLEIQNHFLPEQLEVRTRLKEMSEKLGIKLVATNDCHYLNKDDSEAQEVLMCISMKKTFDDPTKMVYGDQFYVKSKEEMEEVMQGYEEAVTNTIEVVEKCEEYYLHRENMIPNYIPPDNKTPKDYLRELAENGIKKKYRVITDEILERLNYELGLIDKMGFNEYFLIVWDYINYAESVGIGVGPGRGSGAGSIVAYAIGITKLDPLRYNLFFERFINPERVSMPDFDVDFEPERTEEVIDYVTRKYGADKVCRIVTYGTLKAKAAIKDVARVFRMPFSEVNALTKNIDTSGMFSKETLRFIFGLADKDKKCENEELQQKYNDDLKYANPELVEMYKNNADIRRVVDIAIKIENMPRNLSVHAAGVVICKEVLSDNIPLARVGDTIVTQYYMIEVEHLGYLKMDFLRLETLSDIKATLKIIEDIHHKKIDFYDMEYDDQNVYNLICSGETDAVFQLESPGFKKFLEKLQPHCLEDIVAGVSLYRPGPMDSIPEYVYNKNNPDKIDYKLPCLKNILESTYGIIVYQEQVMQIVQQMAGYSLGQADNVRRMMGKKQMDKMIAERENFLHGKVDEKHSIDGAIKRGASEELANEIFDKMISFAAYAFNKSHAAAYTFVTYQTAYLKTYYPVEFLVGVLNNRLNKPDDIATYIMYAKSKNYKVLPPNVNKSGSVFSVEDGGIRFGIGALKNMGLSISEKIIEERKLNGEYQDINDLITRTNKYGLNKKGIEALILSGAMDCFNKPRSVLMQVYDKISERVSTDKKAQSNGQMSLFGSLIPNSNLVNKIEYPKIPEFVDNTKLKMEKEIAGVYISGHPLDKFMHKFDKCNFFSNMISKKSNDDEGEEETQEQTNSGLVDGMKVVCGGIINEVNTLYTKRDNKEMAILRVEDIYGGTMDIMVPPKMISKFKPILHEDAMGEFVGNLSVREEETPLIILENFSPWNTEEEQKNDVVEKQPQKRLYLKFDMTNEQLKNAVMDIISNHFGESEVFIRCSATNQAFKLTDTIKYDNLLEYELLSLLPPQNIKFE